MYQRNLNNAFAAATDREYRTPIDAIAEAALLWQNRLNYSGSSALVIAI
jgi:hypothetical protein